MTSKFPLIVDIKRHSLEDGPGIRSVVFFKGCPLRCIFCHNPQMQEEEAELAFFEMVCIQCGECKKVCLEDAIDYKLSSRICRDKCSRCGRCAYACPTGALRLIGKYYPLESLIEILLRDISFYRHSGGGVTLSGGEPLLYISYVEALLKSLKEEKIHIAIETSGYFDYDTFEQRLLPYIDIIYYDIKIADPEIHKNVTGKSNQRILDNLKRLIKKDVEVYPRIPLIPDITATYENLTNIVDFLCNIGAEEVFLLPYNPMGVDMYEKLGRPKPLLPEGFIKPEEEMEVYDMFKGIIKERKENKILMLQKRWEVEDEKA